MIDDGPDGVGVAVDAVGAEWVGGTPCPIDEGGGAAGVASHGVYPDAGAVEPTEGRIFAAEEGDEFGFFIVSLNG